MAFSCSLSSFFLISSISATEFSPFDSESIVFGQRGFIESDAVKFLLAELDGEVCSERSHLLIQDVLDVVSPLGVVGSSLFYGLY